MKTPLTLLERHRLARTLLVEMLCDAKATLARCHEDGEPAGVTLEHAKAALVRATTLKEALGVLDSAMGHAAHA